jgi:hypothetical protein
MNERDSNGDNAKGRGSFEVPQSPGLESLKKLMYGFCGDRTMAMDASDRSPLLVGDDATRSSRVVRDLNKVLDGASVLTDEKYDNKSPAAPEEEMALKNQTMNTGEKSETISVDGQQRIEEEEELIAKPIVTPVVAKTVRGAALNERWSRSLEATFVTILTVLLTFFIIQRLDGNVGISIMPRDERFGVQVQHAVETEIVKQALKGIDPKKIVEETFSELRQDQHLALGRKSDLLPLARDDDRNQVNDVSTDPLRGTRREF